MMKLQDLMDERSHTREGQTTVVFYSLFILTNRIQTEFDNMGDELTLKQLMLLILIAILGAGSYTQLGELMGTSRQNAKKLASALERKGYVTIETDPADRRAVIVRPTAKIQDHFDQRDPVYESSLAVLFQDFTDDEIGQLFKLVPKLLSGTDKMKDMQIE